MIHLRIYILPMFDESKKVLLVYEHPPLFFFFFSRASELTTEEITTHIGQHSSRFGGLKPYRCCDPSLSVVEDIYPGGKGVLTLMY